MPESRFELTLSPAFHLGLAPAAGGIALDEELAQRLASACVRSNGHTLLQLAGAEVATALPAALAYWRELGKLYLTAVCTHPSRDGEQDYLGSVAETGPELAALAEAPPVMPGAEYITLDLLRTLLLQLDQTFRAEHAASGVRLQQFLEGLHPSWNLVGRVHFHLAENRKDDRFPFAFLATYSGRLATGARPQHQPLGQALREYSGPGSRKLLLSLLLPVQRAAVRCAWLRTLVDSGEIYHPLRWTPAEALQLLKDLPALEQAGVVVRMPANWTGGRPPTPRLTVTVGGRSPSFLGVDSLLDFQVQISIAGAELSKSEIEDLLARTDGLALIRGQWVQADRERLARILSRYRQLEGMAQEDGLSFAAAMRMLAGAEFADAASGGDDVPDWTTVTAGPWLAETLAQLRSPAGLGRLDPGGDLLGTLRPYQQVGLSWLHLLSQLGLGACLADDMGLGKTIQVLALLLVLRGEGPGRDRRHRRGKDKGRPPSLLVAPASLLANWAAEIERFTPSLKAVIAHASAMPSPDLKASAPSWIDGADLVITSYATLLRLPALVEQPWDLVILDEAQAIRNPGTRQTKAVKMLRGRARITLTGTPIENRLGDLWSIFDFINPGLLGGRKQFNDFVNRLNRRTQNPYAPLRNLVRPYILRRLKTDRSVISDLPEKTEVRAYCNLSRRQAALYEQAVRDLARLLAEKEGIERRGAVLAALMRFKQICNHPSQWLGDGAWAETDSGKWERLRQIAEVIAARQEKVLVFTQFREITAPLADFLGEVFGRPGLVLHGQTAVGKRNGLVRQFQEDENCPFMVLSLKAGGSGLNLTAAAHVVHFDRWWNPAVENQATDRAFRIGQQHNVLVHKFICRGTVEERIDALIASKEQIVHDLFDGRSELLLTEMSDKDLLNLVSLDLRSALKE